MRLARQVFVVVVLGACAAVLAQADARQRSAKHAANTGRHVGQHRPSGDGIGGPGNASHASHDINPDLIFVPPPRRNAKPDVDRQGPAKKAAARPASRSAHRRQPPDTSASVGKKNAIGVATPPAGAGSGTVGGEGNAGSSAGGGVKANAIGVPRATAGWPPPAPAGKIGAANPAGTVHATPPMLPAHGGINGTGITRAGVAPATIGGPAKVAAGIGGTGLKPKR